MEHSVMLWRVQSVHSMLSSGLPNARKSMLRCLGHVQVAQAVLIPLLVDKMKVGPAGQRSIKNMMMMMPPTSFQVRQFCRQQ